MRVSNRNKGTGKTVLPFEVSIYYSLRKKSRKLVVLSSDRICRMSRIPFAFSGTARLRRGQKGDGDVVYFVKL